MKNFCYNPKCKLNKIEDEDSNRRKTVTLGFDGLLTMSKVGETYTRHEYAYQKGGVGSKLDIKTAFFCNVCSGAIKKLNNLKE